MRWAWGIVRSNKNMQRYACNPTSTSRFPRKQIGNWGLLRGNPGGKPSLVLCNVWSNPCYDGSLCLHRHQLYWLPILGALVTFLMTTPAIFQNESEGNKNSSGLEGLKWRTTELWIVCVLNGVIGSMLEFELLFHHTISSSISSMGIWLPTSK